MSQRAATLTLAALLLAGCTSGGDSNYAQVWQVMRTSLKASFGNQKVTRAQAAAIPYASMGWRLDGGNQNLIVLASDTGGEQLWTSAARIVLVTHDGRLIRSIGLGHDLAGMASQGETLRAPAAALAAPFTSHRTADFADMGHYGVAIDCHAHTVARQTIAILGQRLPVARVDEDCYSRSLRWRFTDSYWVDPEDGTVWRSLQHYHPQAGALETELFRPPG